MESYLQEHKDDKIDMWEHNLLIAEDRHKTWKEKEEKRKKI